MLTVDQIFTFEVAKCMFQLFVFLFVPAFSSCHEKATEALYFGRIILVLEYPIPSFSVTSFDFSPVNLLLVQSHQVEIVFVKRSNVCDEGGS